MLPLILSATGILVCILTSFFATNVMIVNEKTKVQFTLKWQIIISTIILTLVLINCCLVLLPEKMINLFNAADLSVATPVGVMVCALTGLWAGLIIGYVTDFFASNSHYPTLKLATSC